MFRIIGDEIEFNSKTIGKLTAPTFDFCRLEAIDFLDGLDPSQDERDREATEQKWRDEYDAGQKEDVDALEMKIADLEQENKRLHAILEEIDDGDTCLDLIAKAQAETAKWREIAETNRAAYFTATQRKRRVSKPRAAI